MANKAFEPNVEYVWKLSNSWMWSTGGQQRDWNASNNWTVKNIPKGWAQEGPAYVISVVFSDQRVCMPNSLFYAKCTADQGLCDRTHVRELWRWKHSGQLVKEFCRDLTAEQLSELQSAMAKF